MLNIVVALPCEAKPLISYFQLKKQINNEQELPFPIFTNKDHSINLIVTGVGKIKMAAATASIAMLTYSHSINCFLNVGIAGSAGFSVGQSVLINKITEESTGRNWYPFIPLAWQAQGALVTFDKPQLQYPQKSLIDMEGSAFFQSAAFFVPQEHIQILKIVSDNTICDQRAINESLVKSFITDNILQIAKISDYLIKLMQKEKKYLPDLACVDTFHKNWHFTCSEKIQLKEYLRRWKIQIAEDPFLFCKEEKHAKNVIRKLSNRLEQILT